MNSIIAIMALVVTADGPASSAASPANGSTLTAEERLARRAALEDVRNIRPHADVRRLIESTYRDIESELSRQEVDARRERDKHLALASVGGGPFRGKQKRNTNEARKEEDQQEKRMKELTLAQDYANLLNDLAISKRMVKEEQKRALNQFHPLEQACKAVNESRVHFRYRQYDDTADCLRRALTDLARVPAMPATERFRDSMNAVFSESLSRYCASLRELVQGDDYWGSRVMAGGDETLRRLRLILEQNDDENLEALVSRVAGSWCALERKAPLTDRNLRTAAYWLDLAHPRPDGLGSLDQEDYSAEREAIIKRASELLQGSEAPESAAP